MTNADEFKRLLLEGFESGFGARMGKMVYERNLYETALNLAIEHQRLPLPATDRARIAFRAAYALESAFFMAPERFRPYLETFVEAFPGLRNRSVHRHFGKIMAALLRGKAGYALRLTPGQASAIAETCADWLADPKERVGVKVWALEILKQLAPQVDWVAELLPDVIGLLAQDPSPAMTVRLRRRP